MGVAPKYPAAIPTLDELAMRSDRVHGLAPEVLIALMVKAAAVQNLLAAKALSLTIANGAHPPGTRNSDQGDLMSIEAAAAILGRSRNWLLRNRNKKHLPFIRQVSDKTFMVSESSLRKWIEGRPGNARKLDSNITDSYNESHDGPSDQGTPRTETAHAKRAGQEVEDHTSLLGTARNGREK
jgi:Helix-turn-helix domain